MPDALSIPRGPDRGFQGILLDLFGTLIPSGDQATRVRRLAEMAEILEVDPAAFPERWLDRFDERTQGTLGTLEETILRLAQSLGGHPSADQVRQSAEIRLEYTRQLLASCGPSLPGLDALRSAGFRLALVTNTSEETVRLWAGSPLASRMDATVFSCSEHLAKPDPRIYRLALARLGLEASECAFVGDGGNHELTGAKEVGLTAFLYRFPDEREETAFRIDSEPDWAGGKLRTLDELIRFRPAPGVRDAA
jgi:putative hydrolase of the HAD superfamily